MDDPDVIAARQAFEDVDGWYQRALAAHPHPDLVREYAVELCQMPEAALAARARGPWRYNEIRDVALLRERRRRVLAGAREWQRGAEAGRDARGAQSVDAALARSLARMRARGIYVGPDGAEEEGTV